MRFPYSMKGFVVLILGLFILSFHTTSHAQSNTLWLAQYFNNTDFNAPAAVTAYESDVDFNWGNGAPSPGVNADNFSARWSTTVFFSSGVYRFVARADDEVRVYIDNTELVIDTFGRGRVGVPIVVEVPMAQGFHNIQVDYREYGGAAFVSLEWELADEQVVQDSVTGTWIAEYYNNRNLNGSPSAIFSVASPNNNWGNGSPVSNINADNFSARWSTTLDLDGTYLMEVRADDGVRVYINNILFIDEWHTAQASTYSNTFNVPAGSHSITIEYFEGSGLAFLEFNLTEAASEAGLWTAEFYPNPDLVGAPTATSIASSPDNNWGLSAPFASMPDDNFSVRWTSTQTLESGTYRLSIRCDDGVRVYINGRLRIDQWNTARDETYTAELPILDGDYNIVIEYFERGGTAFIEYDLTRIGDYTVQPERLVTATGYINTTRLNVRDIPSANDSNVIAQVELGERFTIVGRNADSSWLEIQLDENTTGWVFARFVDVTNPEVVPVTSEDERPDFVPTPYTLSATTEIRIRSLASTRSAILGELPANRSANIIARNNSATWWFIEYNGLTGWVSADFLRLPANLDLSQIPVR